MEKKIINNAISAYFGMWVLLLLPTKNEYIKNSFVKSHAKTASLIHLFFLITYIIFIWYWFLWKTIIPFIEYNLNNLIACVIFIILFLFLLFWSYKASKWETFSLSKINNKDWESLIEIKNAKIWEQGKLTLVLSYIPFIWYYIYSNFYNYKSPIIINNVKLNVVITYLLVFIFILWYPTLVNLLALIYIIFIIFLWVLIVVNEKLININLSFIPTFVEAKIYLISLFKYLKKYFSKKEFVSLKTITKEEYLNFKANEKLDKEILLEKKDIKLPKYLIYIPFINILTVFEINSKYKNHIINWLLITILSLIILFIDNNYQLILLLPIFSWIGFLWKIEYKIPFIYDIYEIFLSIKNIFFKTSKKIKEKQEKVEEISFNINDK